MDTLIDFLDIVDKPPVKLAFKDTLICVNDILQLNAGANGTLSWSPTLGMTNANTKTPTVSPAATITYYVDLDDNGCLNRDSVKVRVTDKVYLQAMNDTTICEGDTIELHVDSDGSKYLWTPASQLSNALSAKPEAVTNSTTAYYVTASIGGCSATEMIVVNTVPYPRANAGPDTVICDQTTGQLNASIVGSTFTWSPSSTLINTDHLNPVATPKATTTYQLVVYDNKGCPKPAIDEVSVKVLPPIIPVIGNDTAIIRGQPLQLYADGGTGYVWSPSIGLSNTNISNPIATIMSSGGSVRYKVDIYNEAGCSDSAFVSVKVFATLPTVFVPNAFTPNRNGRNDFLKPIAVGMKHIEYFRVYNRWGQMVFSAGDNRQGWDGTLSGKLQSPGIYVWAVKAIDYTGKPYTHKGTAVLIR
jgi:gliding motility-associated-like protein